MYTNFRTGNTSDCRIQIGGIIVELSQGDILHANTDVIVNSTNGEFSLGGRLEYLPIGLITN